MANGAKYKKGDPISGTEQVISFSGGQYTLLLSCKSIELMPHVKTKTKK
jgi:hypothetical protein